MSFVGIKAGGTTRLAQAIFQARKDGGCLDGGKMRDILKSPQKGNALQTSELAKCFVVSSSILSIRYGSLQGVPCGQGLSENAELSSCG